MGQSIENGAALQELPEKLKNFWKKVARGYYSWELRKRKTKN